MSVRGNQSSGGSSTGVASPPLTANHATDVVVAYNTSSGLFRDSGITADDVVTKGATLTANTAAYASNDGVIKSSSVTKTELEYVSGVTSAIQTQFAAKANNAPTITQANLNATNAAVTQNYVDQAGANMIAIANMVCTITTTRTNEIVQLIYNGDVVGGAASHDIFYGYQIDSGTPVCTGEFYVPITTQPQTPISINRFITITGAPGSYAVKLAASRSTGSPVIRNRPGNGTSTDPYIMAVIQW